jgi:hypothetical protein
MIRSIQCLPFNHHVIELYAKQFETEISQPFRATISLITSPSLLHAVSSGKIHDRLERIAPVVAMLDGSPLGNTNRLVHIETAIVGSCPVLWDLLLPHQRAWIIDDIYLQVSYSVDDVIPYFNSETSAAYSMTLYDFLVERHHSFHTCDHEPIEMSADKVRSLRLHMGRSYQEGLIVWSKHHMHHRNMLSVMAHAALAGEDPVEAYRKFLESSQFYFLPIVQCHWTMPNESYVVCDSKNFRVVGDE